MTRDLWIPLAGTLAAVLAVLAARGGDGPEAPGGGPSWHGDTGPVELRLRLEPDGSLHDLDGEARYRDAEALLLALPGPSDETNGRIAVALEAAAGVDTPRLLSVAAALRARCDVRIEQSDDQAKDLPREEGRPLPEEEEGVPRDAPEGGREEDRGPQAPPAPAR